MTVKQLLDSLSYDEIAPYITKRYEDYEDAESVLADYKQHYDYLRHLVPTDPALIENKEVRISYYDYEDESGVHLDAYPLEGDLWADSLSKELIIAEEVKEGNAEIAACCLWHMSFYGYLPYQRQVCFDNIFGGIEKQRARAKAYKEKFAEIIPSEKEIMKIRSFHNELKSKTKEFRHVRYRCANKHSEDHILIPKRKKKGWRYWKRYLIARKLYKRICYISSFIEDILERGHNVSEIPTLQELGILYRSNRVSIKRLDSIAFDASKRFGYLKELIEKYRAMDRARKNMSEHAGCFICLSASSAHPVMKQEESIVSILTKGLSGKHQFCIKVDDSCGEELRIDIAYYNL